MSEPEYNFTLWKSKTKRDMIGLSRVRLNRQAMLTISDDLFNQYFSLEFNSVEVFIDSKQKAIGLKPSNDKDVGYTFKKVGTSPKIQSIFLKTLVVQYDIAPETYIAKWSEKNKMVIFNYHILEAKKE